MVVPEGKKFVDVDLAQAELRMLSHTLAVNLPLSGQFMLAVFKAFHYHDKRACIAMLYANAAAAAQWKDFIGAYCAGGEL